MSLTVRRVPKAPKVSMRVQESAKDSESSRVQAGGEVLAAIFLPQEAVKKPLISLGEQAGGGGPGRDITGQAPNMAISRAS